MGAHLVGCTLMGAHLIAYAWLDALGWVRTWLGAHLVHHSGSKKMAAY